MNLKKKSIMMDKILKKCIQIKIDVDIMKNM